MSARNHTLIIDGNYFIYSRLFVLPRQKMPAGFGESIDIDTRFMSSQSEMNIFMRKLATDFSSELRKLKNITGRIIFTLDSKSWRKDLYPSSEYKANREQDSKIHWSNVHNVIEEFTDLLKSQGVIIHRVSGAEGDDLIYAWTCALNSKGENCIIWSGDTDLMQLVNYNRSTDTYTLWYDNTRSRIGIYPGFIKYLNIKEEKIDKRKTMPHLFKKGHSGNPNGRPKGSKNYGGIAAGDLLQKNASQIMAKIIEKALEGNETCLKMCVDRILPSTRAIDITKTEKQNQDINIYVENMEDKRMLEHKKAEVIDITPLKMVEKVS